MPRHNFYQRLDCPYYPAMQQQLVRWASDLDLVHPDLGVVVTTVDIPTLMLAAPDLERFLVEQGLTCTRANLWKLEKTFERQRIGAIHIDYAPTDQAVLEIPIIGHEQSSTVFYSAPVLGPANIKNGLPYWLCDASRARELDRVRLTGPTATRIDVPRGAELDRTFTTRMSLLLKTAPGAERLIPDAY